MKYAAIDIGTNATRLLIGEVDITDEIGFIKKHSYTRVPLRLGEEVFETGLISRKKAIDFKKSMKAFKLISETFDVKDIRVCATSAMREAINAHEIRDYVEQNTGLEIEVISGKEEAELIFSTFMLLQSDTNIPFLVIDVGGGSTEISVFESGQRVAAKSFQIGTLRILKNKVGKGVWKSIENWLQKYVHSSSHNYSIYATGGNINKAHKLIGGLHLEPISLHLLADFNKELKELTINERINKFQLRPDRADVIVPALDIYTYIVSKIGAKEIIVPKVGLADGMIYNLFLKHSKYLRSKK